MKNKRAMWNLYRLSQTTHRPPSEIVGLAEFCRDLTGLPGRDDWTCFQFDSAVSALGVYIENRLNQMDKKGRPKHSLDKLLEESGDGRANFLKFFHQQRAMGQVIDL